MRPKLIFLQVIILFKLYNFALLVTPDPVQTLNFCSCDYIINQCDYNCNCDPDCTSNSTNNSNLAFSGELCINKNLIFLYNNKREIRFIERGNNICYSSIKNRYNLITNLLNNFSNNFISIATKTNEPSSNLNRINYNFDINYKDNNNNCLDSTQNLINPNYNTNYIFGEKRNFSCSYLKSNSNCSLSFIRNIPIFYLLNNGAIRVNNNNINVTSYNIIDDFLKNDKCFFPTKFEVAILYNNNNNNISVNSIYIINKERKELIQNDRVNLEVEFNFINLRNFVSNFGNLKNSYKWENLAYYLGFFKIFLSNSNNLN